MKFVIGFLILGVSGVIGCLVHLHYLGQPERLSPPMFWALGVFGGSIGMMVMLA